MRTRFWRVRTRKGDGLEWNVVDEEVKAMVGASENGTRQVGRRIPRSGGSPGHGLFTDPARLALVLDGLLGVRHGPLHVVHGVFHIVLDPVNHLPLQDQGYPRSRPPSSGREGAQGRASGEYPEVRETEKSCVRRICSFSPVPPGQAS